MSTESDDRSDDRSEDGLAAMTNDLSSLDILSAVHPTHSAGSESPMGPSSRHSSGFPPRLMNPSITELIGITTAADAELDDFDTSSDESDDLRAHNISHTLSHHMSQHIPLHEEYMPRAVTAGAPLVGMLIIALNATKTGHAALSNAGKDIVSELPYRPNWWCEETLPDPGIGASLENWREAVRTELQVLSALLDGELHRRYLVANGIECLLRLRCPDPHINLDTLLTAFADIPELRQTFLGRAWVDGGELALWRVPVTSREAQDPPLPDPRDAAKPSSSQPEVLGVPMERAMDEAFWLPAYDASLSEEADSSSEAVEIVDAEEVQQARNEELKAMGKADYYDQPMPSAEPMAHTLAIYDEPMADDGGDEPMADDYDDAMAGVEPSSSVDPTGVMAAGVMAADPMAGGVMAGGAGGPGFVDGLGDVFEPPVNAATSAGAAAATSADAAAATSAERSAGAEKVSHFTSIPPIVVIEVLRSGITPALTIYPQRYDIERTRRVQRSLETGGPRRRRRARLAQRASHFSSPDGAPIDAVLCEAAEVLAEHGYPEAGVELVARAPGLAAVAARNNAELAKCGPEEPLSSLLDRHLCLNLQPYRLRALFGLEETEERVVIVRDKHDESVWHDIRPYSYFEREWPAVRRYALSGSYCALYERECDVEDGVAPSVQAFGKKDDDAFDAYRPPESDDERFEVESSLPDEELPPYAPRSSEESEESDQSDQSDQGES